MEFRGEVKKEKAPVTVRVVVRGKCLSPVWGCWALLYPLREEERVSSSIVHS